MIFSEVSMAGRLPRDMNAIQKEAVELIARGLSADEIAKMLGVSGRSVRRWRQRSEGRLEPPAPPPATTSGRREQAVGDMLRAEGPAVARVLVDLAKDGDVRAAALIVKLLGNNLTFPEEVDEYRSDAALADLERELQSLPPTIASEIVGLLARAESETAELGGGEGPAAGGGGQRSVRLPWEKDDCPSHEGSDSV